MRRLREAFGGRREQLPDGARRALGLGEKERLLGWSAEDATGTVVAATNHRCVVVDASGDVVLERPWHEVLHGTWDPDRSRLTVETSDGARAAWVFEGEPRLLLQTLRERVQASVVAAEEVDLAPGRRVRVAVRQDLATGELIEQAAPGPRVRLDDPGVADAIAPARARLRDDVGLD